VKVEDRVFDIRVLIYLNIDCLLEGEGEGYMDIDIPYKDLGPSLALDIDHFEVSDSSFLEENLVEADDQDTYT